MSYRSENTMEKDAETITRIIQRLGDRTCGPTDQQIGTHSVVKKHTKIDQVVRKRRHTGSVLSEDSSEDVQSPEVGMQDSPTPLDDNQDNKEDFAKLSKRKKQPDMKEMQQRKWKRPKFEWTESPDDLTLSLRLEGLRTDQMRNIDVQFADTDVTIKLPDGRNWTWIFSDEIFKEQSRVKVKKQRITLHMKKKKQKLWQNLEAEPILPDPSTEQQTEIMSDSSDTPASEPEEVNQSTMEETDESDLPYIDGSEAGGEVSEAGIEKEKETSQEVIVDKAEEPVVELQHIKHDYIEKDDTFVVHVYVKGVDKDNVVVNFESTTFRVKFQTGNADFLKLHPNATPETKFSWQVKLKGMVIKERCWFKLTPSFIELSLAKSEYGRWTVLEAVQRKESAVPANESWVSINKVSATSPKSYGTTSKPTEHVEKKAEPEQSRVKAQVKEFSQKPTAKVQPLNKPMADMREQLAVTPGFTGLDNLGNTCFMNGVLQCLANTREFRDFFLDGDFQDDLNPDNVLGSGGKLAVSFAVLMKVLWSGKHYSYSPSKLKNLVAQKASQFTGFAQHDSQEFMAFLLDGLHEDLNRVKKKPYTETVEDGGRPDEVVASQAWAVHKRRNDSFIVDYFQGQYKSKLVCPKCGKVSITFDPFLYLSLPLPRKQRLLPVTIMWRDPFKKPVKFMLRLPKEPTVEVLKDSLQKKTGINPKNLRVFEAYKGRIHKMFERGTSLSNLQANDVIIACEILSEEMAGEPVYEVAVVQRTLMPNQFPTRCHSCKKLCPEGAKLKRCTRCFKVGYCDQTCQKSHWQTHRSQCSQTPEPVGTPFVLSVPESRATFPRLCQLMEAYARYSVDVFQPPVKLDTPKETPAATKLSNHQETQAATKLSTHQEMPATKLSSHQSSSNLSNSSQSSGSLNSLDSQSSFSSSCTITADQEQNIDDPDMAPEGCGNLSPRQLESPVDSGFSSQTGLSIPGGSSESVSPVMGCKPGAQSSIGVSEQELDNKTTADLGGGDGCSEDKNISVTEARKSPVASCVDPSSSERASFTSPVKPVMGVQSGGDAERSTPMFYIKPVSNEGCDLTGSDDERLEDKGDLSLDLTDRFYLSLDWKNNDKLPGYVLVQSKEMESENDSSMMTASLEENNNATLEQCLELFTEPETLAPEEAWYCPQCKEHREATKQLSTWKLPHTLIIQLKRFSFRNFIWRDKIDKMVDFPTRGLDLSAYYLGSRPEGERPPIYDLYGVVNHHGGILGGHYTSYVRCPDKTNSLNNEVGWRLCDDSRVSVISHEKNVVTRAAYLLFYRRREVFIPPPTAGLMQEDTSQQQNTDNAEDDDEDDDNDFESVNSELSRQSDSNSSDAGELIIDASPAEVELELPDLEGPATQDYSEDKISSENEQDIMLDEKLELGYTDMDSVD